MPVGGGMVAVRAAGDHLPVLVPGFIADFVHACTEFRPLGEQLQRFAREHRLDAMQVDGLRQWLPALREAGVFLSDRVLFDGCQRRHEQAAATENAGSIGLLGIPTGNRPEMLRRALESFAQNAVEHGHRPDLLVADNSSQPAHAEGNRAVLQEVCSRLGLRGDYSGPAERESYAARLAAMARVDPEVVRFGLLDVERTGFACGANRNAILLHGAGRLVASVDDDVVCRLAPTREPREELLLFSHRDTVQRFFFENLEEARQAERFEDADYLGLHERLLGRAADACVAEAPRVAMAGPDDDFLRRLESGRGRVQATFAGHVGDPGVPTSCYYLGYRGENLARLTATEKFYRRVLGSRSVLTVARSFSIGDICLSPGMGMGLDHRELLPPFPPVLHAEDFVFGAAVWKTCPGAFSGFVPYAVLHDPGPGKTILTPTDLSPEDPVTVFEFAHVLRQVIMNYEAVGEDSTEARLEGLGRHLEKIGSLEPADFNDFLRAQVLDLVGRTIGFFDELLMREREAADYWQADVEAYCEHLREALCQDGFEVPHDMKRPWTPEEARGLMRRLFQGYGQLLRAWPVLVTAAREMERGQ
jgi:hypothetical protein